MNNRSPRAPRSIASALSILAVCVPFALASVGCDKKGEAGGGAPAASEKPAASAKGSGSAAPSAEVKAPEPLDVAGSYEAKAGEVRTPKDAPTFSNTATGATGKGDLSMVLPATDDGPVTGKASGPLGAQTFSGTIEEGRLTGTLSPADGDKEAMTGTVLATVAGKGDARTVDGTLRASGPDGRVVREASFKLEPKKK
jgi:hypothetical protein